MLMLCLILLTNCAKNKLREFNAPNGSKLGSSLSFLEQSDSLVFHLNDSLHSDFQSLQYIEKSNLILVNGGGNILTWYEMKTGKPTKNIRFDNEGSEGVGRLRDFYYHNEDSLFINDRYVLTLLDGDGFVKNRYRVRGSQEKRGSTTATLFSQATIKQMVLIEDQLFIPSLGDGMIKKNGYTPKSFVTKINLTTNKYEHLVGYSEAYRDGSLWPLEHCTSFFSFVPETKTFIISYPIDKNIYISKDLEHFETKPAKSNFFDELIGYKGDMKNTVQRVQYFVNSFHYRATLYDQYREVYLRVAIHPLNVSRQDVEKAMQTRNVFHPSFSISLFSKDMAKISEQYFSGDDFSPYSFIIHPKGLYIQSSNILNEDQRTFYLMKYDDELLKVF